MLHKTFISPKHLVWFSSAVAAKARLESLRQLALAPTAAVTERGALHPDGHRLRQNGCQPSHPPTTPPNPPPPPPCQRWRARLCPSAICASVNCRPMQIASNCICITFNHLVFFFFFCCRFIGNCFREGAAATGASSASSTADDAGTRLWPFFCFAAVQAKAAGGGVREVGFFFFFDAGAIQSAPAAPYGVLAWRCKCDTVGKINPGLSPRLR